MSEDIELHELVEHKTAKDNVVITEKELCTSASQSDFSDLEQTPRDKTIRAFPDNANRTGTNPTSEKFVISETFWKWIICIYCGNFMCQLDGTIVSTTMSNIASDFNQSDQVNWIATSYLLTSTAFQPMYGKTSDILGRKPMIIFGQVVFTLGLLISSFATSIEMLSIGRAISGIGGAGIFSLSNIIITDFSPLSQRSMFVGYGNIVSSVAQMLGGPVGGFCIISMGWRMMFFLQVPIMIVVTVMTSKLEISVDHVPTGPDRFSKSNLKRIDFGGIITLNLSISSLIFLVNLDSSTSKQICLLILILSLISFYLVEKFVASEKIIDPYLVKGQIGALGVINSVSSLNLYMILFITPIYLQIIQEISVTSIGFYTMFCVVSVALGSLLGGFFIRRFHESDIQTIKAAVGCSVAAFFIQIVGFVSIHSIVKTTNPVSGLHRWRLLYIGGLVTTGIGSGAFGVGVVIFIVGKVGKKGQATANTCASLLRSLGNVLGVAISLSTYTSDVSKRLHMFFKKDNEKLVNTLIRDSQFIKEGLAPEYKKDVLLIYRHAMTISFYPAMGLACIATVVIFVLVRSVAKMK